MAWSCQALSPMFWLERKEMKRDGDGMLSLHSFEAALVELDVESDDAARREAWAELGGGVSDAAAIRGTGVGGADAAHFVVKPSQILLALAARDESREWLELGILARIDARVKQTGLNSLKLLLKWDTTRTGTLSWAEFEVGCIAMKVGCKTEELRLAWHAMDTRRDGLLDYSEIDAAFARVEPAFLRQPSRRLWTLLTAVAESPVFSASMLLLIMLNCASIAVEDPICEAMTSDGDRCSAICPKARTIAGWDDHHYCSDAVMLATSTIEFACLVGFSIELVILLCADWFQYLRSAWSMLDAVIVLLGWVGIFTRGPNFSVLRGAKLLRPLKLLHKVGRLRALIQTLAKCFSELMPVLGLAALMVSVFAVMGIDLFGGDLRQQCVFDDNATNTSGFPAECPHVTSPLCFAEADGPELLCGGARSCPYVDGRPTRCSQVMADSCRNPNPAQFHGLISFDNFGAACLTIMQVLTVEGWVDITYLYQDATGVVAARCFFVILILVGYYFLLNVALAVVTDVYIRVRCGQREKKQSLRRRLAQVRRKLGGASKLDATEITVRPEVAVMHKIRGEGVVVEVDSDEKVGRPLVVRFAAADMHHYSYEQFSHKFEGFDHT